MSCCSGPGGGSCGGGAPGVPEFVVVPVVEVPEPCNDGCCDEPEQKLPEPCNDGCCDEPKQDQEPEDSCCGDCGGDEESERGRSVSASGSAIKLPECCDVECIKKVAAIECKHACEDAVKEDVNGCAGGCCDEPKAASIAEDSIKDYCAGGCCGPPKVEIKDDCNDGCCGPPKIKSEGGCNDGCCGEETSKPEDDDSCKDGCCGQPKAAKADDCKDGCCGEQEVAKDACKDACCGEEAPKKDDSCNAGCCGGGKIVEEKEDCNDGCCGVEKLEKPDDCNKGCCSPSINEKSIGSSASSIDSGRAHRQPKGSNQSCSYHLRIALEKYSSYLESARCICRNVLANTADSRCDAQVRKAKQQNIDARSSSISSSIRAGSVQARRRTNVRNRPTKASNEKCYATCSPDETKPLDKLKEVKPGQNVTVADVEKDSAREHVKLNITGMTCTGCSTKLERILQNINGVSNIDAVFVTNSVDFDVDLGVNDPTKVIQKVVKETGFGCTRIISENQTLDILMSKAQAEKLSFSPIDGICTVDKVDKKTYRVGFNPSIIGARAVLASVPGGELAPPAKDQNLEEGKKRLFSMLWNTVIAAAFTIPVVVLAWSDNPVPHKTQLIVSLVLATVVQAQAIPEFYRPALKGLINERIVEMDMLVVISITAAYGYSVVAVGLVMAGHELEEEAFFETSTLLITLVLFGRLIAAIARVKAVEAVSLRSLQAETAILVSESGENQQKTIDARLLEFDDCILIQPHSQVVTDAQVLTGSSSVDESMVTGESIPVPKAMGDVVIAGTMNGPGTLTVRISRLPGKNSITDIAEMVESAYSAKPKIQDLADKVAGMIVPVVTGIALVVFLIWVAVCLKVLDKNAGGAVGTAITYGIAVLAISCPCAIGLAVPMVLVIAGGIAARAGVIIKNPAATEGGFRITDAVFDKTGTITKADLKVIHQQVLSERLSESKVLSIVKSMIRDNQHPVSMAVSKALDATEHPFIDVEQVESIPGAGITAVWKKAQVKAGNPYWLKIEEHPVVADLVNQGMTLLCVTMDSSVVAVFGLKSSIRDEADAVLAELHRRNIRTHIVSGDGSKVVEDIARTVGVAPENVKSRCSPADKQKYIQGLIALDRKVLFCGDGTNDAVAVAQANVGVQIGSASDVTRATADVILLGGLEGIPTLLDTSKRSYNRMVFNFVWSGVYNFFAILLASGAFVKFRVPPAYAGLGEIVSVLPVIFAAMTMLYKKKPKA